MSARTSLLHAFAQNYAILVIRLGALVVLSRLLTPSELGIFIAASAIVALINVLADCGLTQFAVQARSLTPRLERSIMGCALLAAWLAGVAALGVSALAPPSLLNEDVRLATAVLAATFLPYPFAVVGTALLHREMRFRDVATVKVTAAASSVGAAIVLAYLGAGYMSLAWGAVVESLVTGFMIARRHPPVWPALKDWRILYSFSWVWSSTNGLKQASDAVVRLGVSAALGLSSVGVLARAQNVILMFDRIVLDAVGAVLLPTLSKRLREKYAEEMTIVLQHDACAHLCDRLAVFRSCRRLRRSFDPRTPRSDVDRGDLALPHPLLRWSLSAILRISAAVRHIARPASPFPAVSRRHPGFQGCCSRGRKPGLPRAGLFRTHPRARPERPVRPAYPA